MIPVYTETIRTGRWAVGQCAAAFPGILDHLTLRRDVGERGAPRMRSVKSDVCVKYSYAHSHNTSTRAHTHNMPITLLLSTHFNKQSYT